MMSFAINCLRHRILISIWLSNRLSHLTLGRMLLLRTGGICSFGVSCKCRQETHGEEAADQFDVADVQARHNGAKDIGTVQGTFKLSGMNSWKGAIATPHRVAN